MILSKFRNAIFFILLMSTQYCYSEYPLVHSEDKIGLYSLIKKIGIDESSFSVTDRKQYTDTYKEYFIVNKRYAGVNDNNLSLVLYTDQENKVIGLNLNRINVENLLEIAELSSLKVLELVLTNTRDLEGVNRLKNLNYIKIVGTDRLKSLNYFRNMPSLKKIDASTLGELDTAGIQRLTNLQEFLCDSCTISDMRPFESMKNLRVFKSGVNQKDISALYGINNLEILEVGGKNLTDISAVNSMRNLKHLKVYDSSMEKIDLDGSTKHLEFIRIVDSPIKKLPEFKLFNSLKDLSIVGTEVEDVDSIHDLPELERLVLARNLKLKTVKNLKNLPKLKELKAYNGGVDEFTTGVLPSLEELTLSKTNLNRLPSLDNYPSLRELDIKETQITSLKGVDVAPNLYRVYADYDVIKAPENEKLLRELRKNRFKWMKDQKKE